MAKEEVKEILEKQLVLLSERSKDCSEEYIVSMSNAMATIATALRLF